MQIPVTPEFRSTGQTIPHPPQFLESLVVSTQLPLQTVPAHDPLRQHVPLGQVFPQLPQLLLSVWVLTHVGEPFTVHTLGRPLGQ